MKELFTPSHFKAENHLPILKQIKETGVKFYITGSFALSVFKIIRRPINDLDIIVKTREDFENHASCAHQVIKFISKKTKPTRLIHPWHGPR